MNDEESRTITEITGGLRFGFTAPSCERCKKYREYKRNVRKTVRNLQNALEREKALNMILHNQIRVRDNWGK